MLRCESRQQLPFGAKAVEVCFRIEVLAGDLDRDALLEFAVDATGFPNRPHAAFTDLRHQLIGTQALGASAEKRAGGLFGFEQRFNFFVDRLGGFVEQRSPRVRRQVRAGLEEFLNLIPRSAAAHGSLPCSCRNSQARATRHSVFTVVGERSMT